MPILLYRQITPDDIASPPSGGDSIMRFGWTEILLVVGLVLVLFGPRRLPDLARSIGKSVSEFKKGIKEVTDEIEPEDNKKPDTK